LTYLPSIDYAVSRDSLQEQGPRWGSTVAFHTQRVVLGESFAERHAVEIPATVAPLAVLLWEAFGAHYGHEIGEA
jgi:hypothetical protein